MRPLALLIALLVACPAWAKAPCESPNPEVASAVRALTADRARDERARLFAVFSAHPRDAACALVSELKPVTARVVKPDEAGKYRSAMHVIWSLRALRYIAACQDFRAATAERFGGNKAGNLADARAQFLGRDGPGKTPFFSVWMSRDIVFVAARDAQASIIRQWKSWLSRSGEFEFKPCSDSDGWYF